LQVERVNLHARDDIMNTSLYLGRSFSIKFRPIKQCSPHLCRKAQRAQKTDVQESYSTVDLDDPRLLDTLQEWQHHYNTIVAMDL
jgi:hypothetical protein